RSDARHLSWISAPERRPRRRSRPAPAGLGRPRGAPRGARQVLRARGRGEERNAALGDHRRASRRRAVEPPPGCGKRGRGTRRDGLGRGRVARGPGGSRPAVCRRCPLASRDGRRQAPVRGPRRRGQPLSRRALGLATRAVVVRGVQSPVPGCVSIGPMTPSVTPFRSHLPVKIAFGDGTIALLPDALATLRAATALVVVEEPVAEHSGVTAALAASESGGVRLERVVKGPGEPTFALADELAARVRDGGLDAVVGIGGGSALDVAKAARIAADQGGATGEDASGARVPEPPRIGLVLCPTTSGTGSEVSGASVLTDTERDRKIGFGYPH